MKKITSINCLSKSNAQIPEIPGREKADNSAARNKQKGITSVILRNMKTAISIPNNVFEQAENLARKLKISRSELFTEAVKVYLKENQVEDVTAKLNEVYENAASNLDNDLLKAQMASLSKEKW